MIEVRQTDPKIARYVNSKIKVKLNFHISKKDPNYFFIHQEYRKLYFKRMLSM